MEPHPGVFCSNVRTGEWEPDPEVPGSEMHELVHADGVLAGLTRFTTVEGPSPWTPSQRETIHVLEGEVTIEIAGGPALRLKPGDLASLPAGLETIWHITPPFTELWGTRLTGSSPATTRRRALTRQVQASASHGT